MLHGVLTIDTLWTVVLTSMQHVAHCVNCARPSDAAKHCIGRAQALALN